MDDLHAAYDRLSEESRRIDAGSFVLELMAALGATTNLPELASRLCRLQQIDFATLRAGLGVLASADLKPFPIPDSRTIEPGAAIGSAKGFISRLESEVARLDAEAVVWRLEFGGDNDFFDLLLCAAHDDRELPDLCKRAASKLESVDESQIAILWARLVREFSELRTTRFPSDSPRLPPRFFEYGSAEAARKKIADYIVHIKPQIVHDLLMTGGGATPLELVGLARLLAWSPDEPGVEVDETEVVLARSISRVACLADKFGLVGNEDVAAALRVEPSSYFLEGPEFVKMAQRLPTLEALNHQLFYECSTILRIAADLVTRVSPVERALLQYKLGHEVVANEIRRLYAGRGELSLQRELCRFLIERDLYAIGTKFGSSEIDLLVEHYQASFVIEVKLIRPSANATPASIKRALIQLQSYMDQTRRVTRGVLLIVNMASTTIISPRKWLHGRYWILPVNLHTDTPSKRRRTLQIEEVSGTDLIEVVQLNA